MIYRTEAGEDSPSEQEHLVRVYLQQHPEFFEQHQDLLALLHLPDSEAGSASSLLLRQVALLRQQGLQLDAQLRQEREHRQQWQDLTAGLLQRLRLISAVSDSAALYSILREGLYSLFAATHFSFYVFTELPSQLGPQYRCHSPAHRIRALMSQLFNVGKPLIDSLQSEYLQALFARDAEQVRSSYLLPVTHVHWQGLLVLGSDEQHRYQHGPELQALRALLECAANRLDSWMH